MNEDRWKVRSPTNDQLGVGIADYLNELEVLLKTAGPQAVLLGHSMGAVLAQQLAAKGLARAIVLVSPAPRAGHVAAYEQLEPDFDADIWAAAGQQLGGPCAVAFGNQIEALRVQRPVRDCRKWFFECQANTSALALALRFRRHRAVGLLSARSAK